MDTTFWLSLGLIIPLLAVSAFLSGSETALTAVNRARLFGKSAEETPQIRAVLRLMENPERLLGAILIGNNLVNVLMASLATFALVRVFGESGVAVATLVITALIVVLAEITPKTYAYLNPEGTALRVGSIIEGLVRLLRPALWLVRVLTRGILASLGVSTSPDQVLLGDREDIRGAITMGHKSGAVVKADRDIMLAALDLSDADVTDVMTHRGNVDMIDGDADLETCLDTALGSAHTRLPIWRGTHDSIQGIVHIKDLVRAAHAHRKAGRDPADFNLVKIAQQPWYVPETRSLDDQLRAFRLNKNKLALVVDEYGDFQGVVTMEDVLEAIVGEFSDEHDLDEEGVVRLKDGTLRVDGSVTLRNLNRTFDWNLPDEHATTIAGLVIHEARRIPEVGQSFSFYNFRFNIEALDGNRIARMIVRPPATLDRIATVASEQT